MDKELTATEIIALEKKFEYLVSDVKYKLGTVLYELEIRISCIEEYIEKQKNMPTVDCGELNKLINGLIEAKAQCEKN